MTLYVLFDDKDYIGSFLSKDEADKYNMYNFRVEEHPYECDIEDNSIWVLRKNSTYYLITPDKNLAKKRFDELVEERVFDVDEFKYFETSLGIPSDILNCFPIFYRKN